MPRAPAASPSLLTRSPLPSSLPLLAGLLIGLAACAPGTPPPPRVAVSTVPPPPITGTVVVQPQP
jgi:hypothetical protein